MTELSILLVAILMLVAALIAAMVYMAKKVGGKGEKELRSVTSLTTQIAALVWVSVSYLIALYATVQLGQPFPIVELSQQAITTILGVNVLKVVENIFEHNDGAVFGKTDKNRQDTD